MQYIRVNHLIVYSFITNCFKAYMFANNYIK